MRRSTLAFHFLQFAVSTVLLTAAAQAQYRASIQGVVTDQQGAVVSDADITLKNQETSRESKTTTDAAGIYNFSALAPSLYTITVEKSGFKQKILENIDVVAEQANSVNIQIEIGQATETVTVTDATPPIDTETGNVAGTLSSVEIQALPSVGGDPYQLARLAPGVFGDGAMGGGGNGTALPGSDQRSSSAASSIFMTENQPQVTAGGTRNNGNSYQIDGVEVNSLAWGGSAVITPNEEAVKEVQIQANPYSAENGRNSGAQVLVVTKNGTNQFHGSAFIQLHRPGLDAYQPWNGPFPGTTAPFGHQRDANRFNRIGGSVGGPIWKNKAFFFFSYETLRNTVKSNGPNGWFDTPQFDSLVASTNPSSIASNFTGFPGTTIKFAGINPVTCTQAGLTEGVNCVTVLDTSGANIGLNVGSPLTSPLGTKDPGGTSGLGGGLCNNGSIPCIPDIFNVSTLQVDKNIAAQWNGRTDFQLTNKDLIAFTVFWVPNNNDGFFNGPPRAQNLWNSDRLNYSFATLWDHTFNPGLLNEARFNVTRWWFDEAKSNPQLAFGFPDITFQNMGLGIGVGQCQYCTLFGPSGPGQFYQTTYNMRDTLTKVYKSHSLKFGTDIYKEQDNDITAWAGLPSYNFNNLWDFANDAPTLEVGGFDPRTGQPHSSIKHVRSNIYGFFVQDDYRVKRNLTVNLGLRWEYFGPIHEKDNQLSTAVLGTGANTLTGLKMQVGGNQYHTSYNNWGPQIGFAWSPTKAIDHDFNSRFVVRGGFGVAYNRMQEAVTLNGRFNPPLDESFSYWNGTALTGSNVFYALANDVHNINTFPVNPNVVETFDPTTNLPLPNGCLSPPCTVGVAAFDKNLPTPVVYRYSLEGQYDLGARWVATVGYQGSQSRHFTRQVNNLNWLYPNNLNPVVSGVDFYTNDANGSYNALLTRIQHQFARSFSVDAQYAYSSCKDHGSSDYYSDPYPLAVGPALGHCDFDVTNNFKAFGIWSPHIFGGQHGVMEKTLGGWQFSGIFTYHTGFPFGPYFDAPTVNGRVAPASYKGGAGNNSSNSTFQKQSVNGNFSQLASLSCPCTSIPYFGIPTLTGPGGLPTAPGLQRNMFRGPRYRDFDVTISKDFRLPNVKPLGENAKLSIRADLYNLFNNLNISPISGYQHLGSLGFDGSGNTVVNSIDSGFGRGSSALGSRVVEFQARFQF